MRMRIFGSSGMLLESSEVRFEVTFNRYHRNRALHFPFERSGVPPSEWCVQCMCGSVWRAGSSVTHSYSCL